MKLNMIAKVEKKKSEHEEDGQNCGCAYLEDQDIYPCQNGVYEYNQGQEDYGDREIGLDVRKLLLSILMNEYPKGIPIINSSTSLYKLFPDEYKLAQALKANEGEIIVEKK